MRAGTILLTGSAALLAFASAHSAGAVKSAPRAVGTAAQIIEGRQSAFLLSGALLGSMKASVDRGEDVKGQAFAARSLAKWAKALPGMFPEGSGIEPSGALPAVWKDRAGFEAKAAAYAMETEKLAALATANDKPGFAAQWAVVRETCNACHTGYRKPDNK